jgi:glycerol-3-phosphate dehydrogenase
MNRSDMLARLSETDDWDVLVIGGGATGLGVAVDAAARGYRTVLAERDDFAKGTSSRSTKLVHGGVRYLEQGRIRLVFEALRERGRLRRNAPHLVRARPFVVPGYRWWERPYYGLGLKVYDLLAAGQRGDGFGRSRLLSRAETARRLPTLASEGLRGGVCYRDGQFDDARLAIALARTAARQGAAVLNRLRVTRLTTTGKDASGGPARIDGAVARDEETGREHRLRARVVINATGVFADDVRRLDAALDRDGDRGSDGSSSNGRAPMLRTSRGAHLVLGRAFLPGDHALMIPQTDDGRVLFAIPWQGRVIVGTTDTPTGRPSAEPHPSRAELRYLLDHAGRYLSKKPRPEDVLSVFAGLRPLVVDPGGNGSDTSDLSRGHALRASRRGLVTVAGGKWTTYRRMAEDAVDRAAEVAGLHARPSPTKTLRLHGWHAAPERALGPFARYGADAPALRRLTTERPALAERLHPDLPYRKAEVVWAARREMARTLEDVLARRTRALLLDARAAAEAAPETACLLASELGRDEAWVKKQTRTFRELAAGYQMPSAVV